MTNEQDSSGATGDLDGGGAARGGGNGGFVLSTIYTRAGDDGTTTLGDMSRTSKTDARLVAYADCEEANAALGVAVAFGGGLPEPVIDLLARVQNDLFDVGADLCSPMHEGEAEGERLRVNGSYVAYVESACDYYNESLPVLRSFVLPGGTVASALLHQARTVVRRTERSTWQALGEYGEHAVNPETARYLNRLSDLLFILARAGNAESGDMLWEPGLATRTRTADTPAQDTPAEGAQPGEGAGGGTSS